MKRRKGKPWWFPTKFWTEKCLQTIMFSRYELSEPFLWEGMKGKILMNLPIQGQGNQALLQSVRVTDGTVRTHAWCVQILTQCMVLWCLFNYETWHASAESTPGSSAFVWKKPDQIAKLRYAWLPCQQNPPVEETASINGP